MCTIENVIRRTRFRIVLKSAATVLLSVKGFITMIMADPINHATVTYTQTIKQRRKIHSRTGIKAEARKIIMSIRAQRQSDS